MNNATTITHTRTAWFWWGGDCDLCLRYCGLHNDKPEIEPPLHPNCDCKVKSMEVSAWNFERLEKLLERSKRVIREINFLLKDKNLSERDKEWLMLCKVILLARVAEIGAAGSSADYLMNELEKALEDAEKQASKAKYEMSFREANNSVEPGNTIKTGTYSNKAMDKVDELHVRLKAAAGEFGANLRAVEAAFADEYERRRWYWDPIQDRIPSIPNITVPIIDKSTKDIKDYIKNNPRLNDFGLSNIDYNTAARLKGRYYIDIPQGLSLEEYLCTVDGSVRFTGAAIKEAEDELNSFIAELPSEKLDIINSLNQEEKDALLVTIYKRGPDKELTTLDKQLNDLLDKKSRQTYIHIGEGYRAWYLWVNKE